LETHSRQPDKPPPVEAETTTAGPRVGEIVRNDAVRVPAWFTVAAALRVGRLKGVEHLLILDRQQLVGAVSTRALTAAPAHHPVARWMTTSRLSVAPDTSQEAAWRLMSSEGLECLPVVSRGLLLGTVMRSDLSRREDQPG
jgi:Mg/Co/Ni transporter MgtE